MLFCSGESALVAVLEIDVRDDGVRASGYHAQYLLAVMMTRTDCLSNVVARLRFPFLECDGHKYAL